MIQSVRQVILSAIQELSKLTIEELLANRYDKYKQMGQFTE
jgi:acetyl-CoA carboxylase alpha subunit